MEGSVFDAGVFFIGDSSSMNDQRSKDPLHGKTLKAILEELVECYGWEEMSSRISINCFAVDPSLKSSLTFLRKTPWARAKVENLYLKTHGHAIPIRKKVVPPEAKKRLARGVNPAAINVWTGKPLDGE